MSKTNKNLLIPLGMLTVSILLSLVVAELLVRVVRPQPRLVIAPGGFYTADPLGRYQLSPGYRGRIYNRTEYDNAIRINEKGLRGEELDKKTKGRTRLLAIGDSFVFGVGVEDTETFTALIAELPEETGGLKEGLNAGIPAFGVPDAVSWLARYGVDLRPDLVILSIFQGNDLVDASPDREDMLIVDGLLVPSQSSRGVKAWLHRYSHLYLLVKGLLEQPGFLPLRGRLGLREPWRVRVLREEFGTYRKTAPEDLQPAIGATDQALGELVSLGNENGFEVVAVLIPSEIQVDPDRWQGGLDKLNLDTTDFDPGVPTRIFSELLVRNSIPMLDLGPVFRQEISAGNDLYFRHDRHWTTRGHQLAADAIWSFLKQRQQQKESSLEAAAGASSRELED